MGQVTVVKGAYSGYCLWLIQTDFTNPEIRKIPSTRSGFSIPFSSPSFSCCYLRFLNIDMARDGAEPNVGPS